MTFEIDFLKYPEWYRLEKETEKTIDKLSRIEELRFYLKSPDPYYRRLAILKVNRLHLKEAVSYLEEILDNSLENQKNKELAAWTIKKICLKWNLDLFISHRLFYQYSGRESYREMCPVNLEDSFSPLHVKIPSSPTVKRIELEGEDRPLQQDLSFEARFSFPAWGKACVRELMATGKKQLLGFPVRVFRRLKEFREHSLLALLTGAGRMKKLPSLITGLTKTTKTTKMTGLAKSSSSNKEALHHIVERKKAGAVSLAGRVLHAVTGIICWPFRLVFRNKAILPAIIFASYYFLTFTDAGIGFTRDRFGMSLIELQNNFFHTDLMETRDEIFVTVKKILFIAWMQLKDIADWLYYQWLEEIGAK